ncbi:enoyl-CoA hydratase/isomerase family protein [Robbsia sp. KACC 23696]|uniref:enoyl-CoA hydratase/isomerase family protein n=1 Tax=Robbsia sp. KACC 23696 TaxID=3149231 RepID=UPI00325BB5B0
MSDIAPATPESAGPRAGRIVVERDGRMARIVIDAPHKRNSVDGPMLLALADAANTLRHDDDIALVVLCGARGKAFCAGADLDALCVPPLDVTVGYLDRALTDAVSALSAIPMPLVALVEGACIGGGVQLALCADAIIARDDAVFAIPAVQAGMAYPMTALRALASRCGTAATKDFLLFGRRWDAQSALRHGLAQRSGDAAAIADHLAAMRTFVEASPRAATLAYKDILNALAAGTDTTPTGADSTPDRAAQLHQAFAAQRAYLPRLAQFAATRKKEKRE